MKKAYNLNREKENKKLQEQIEEMNKIKKEETQKATEKIKEREYRPFRSIKDGYPRYIISLDKYPDQQEGVHHINAIDLFLGKVKI